MNSSTSNELRRAADELRSADALASKSDKIDRRKVIGRAAANNLSAILFALDSLSAPQSRDAESKLAEAGVFAGHHGLRGLADADEFWEKQPYGTRLYYGDGGMDYLHRGVLQKAVEILDAAPQPPAEAQAQGGGEVA